MQSASQALPPSDRQRICQAVASAEALTSAEIVPVVATSSGRYDRAEDIVGLWFAALAFAVAWYFWPRHIPETGSWGGGSQWLDLAVYLLSLVGGFVVGAILASKIGWLRRLFTPVAMQRDEVQARARHVFFDSRVHHTQTRSGLLIYLSLYEHQAVILADSAIAAKLQPADLESLCQQLTGSLHDGLPLAEALCQTIAAAGRQLAVIAPREAGDVNELPDALVILDQAV